MPYHSVVILWFLAVVLSSVDDQALLRMCRDSSDEDSDEERVDDPLPLPLPVHRLQRKRSLTVSAVPPKRETPPDRLREFLNTCKQGITNFSDLVPLK